MNKFVLIAGSAILSFAPSVALAQDAPISHPYIGAQVGFHNLGIDEDDIDDGGLDLDVDDSGMIYGVYGGVDFDIGSAAVVGAEANFNLGNGPIDSDYGVAGRIGYRAPGGTVVFARVGYQWVNLSAEGLLNLDQDTIDDDDLDVDDTVGDYLVGVGADIAAGPSMGIRVAVDTISFDTLRPTVGAHVRF